MLEEYTVKNPDIYKKTLKNTAGDGLEIAFFL